MREAAWLTGRDVESLPQMRDAAHALIDLGARAVLVKGGHLAFTSDHPAIDVLVLDGSLHELHAERVVTPPGTAPVARWPARSRPGSRWVRRWKTP
jgi:hydroxymethylpyrimidine/phosphomethylpyrimidine kinase